MAGVGSARRLSYGAVAAGAGGVLLIISLFLDWVSLGGLSATGWQVFSFFDIVLFVLGLLAIGYAAIELTATPVNLPVERHRALTVIGIIATTITLEFLIEESHQAFGLFLAVIASLAILIGGYLAERRPELAMTVGGAGAQAEAWRPETSGWTAEPPTQQQQPVSYGTGAAPAAEPVPGPGATAGLGAPPAAAAPPPVAPTPTPPVAATPPAPAEPAPPPGGRADWYPDPKGLKRLRYWDGTQWTEHVAD